MAAYVIFIKERTHNQGELDLYKEMAPAALSACNWLRVFEGG